jgi:hypothetical protein
MPLLDGAGVCLGSGGGASAKTALDKLTVDLDWVCVRIPLRRRFFWRFRALVFIAAFSLCRPAIFFTFWHDSSTSSPLRRAKLPLRQYSAAANLTNASIFPAKVSVKKG